MTHNIVIDFETYSDVDLRKASIHEYVSSPFFKPLLFGFTTFGKTDQNVWDLHNMSFREIADRFHLNFPVHSTLHCFNQMFEYKVLERIGVQVEDYVFEDIAIYGRMYGLNGSLEAMLRQGTTDRKMDYSLSFFTQPQAGSKEFNKNLPDQYPSQWSLFKDYCMTDVLVEKNLLNSIGFADTFKELRLNAEMTHDMNLRGWTVDMRLLDRMLVEYSELVDREVHAFRTAVPQAAALNFNSYPQLKKFCYDRGVKLNSFTQDTMPTAMKVLERRLASSKPLSDVQEENYQQVYSLLELKIKMGGAAPRKLKRIKQLAVESDGQFKLFDNYVHCGAPATWRTTSVGAQIQNLPRLHNPVSLARKIKKNQPLFTDVQTLTGNIRQIFTASHPKGELIIGDLSSIESRGLAWLAGEQTKLDLYSTGQPVYEHNAMEYFGLQTVFDVTPQQRTFGKVMELGCGYQVGPSAFQDFAHSMGIEVSESEAISLVQAWRDKWFKTQQFWNSLNDCMWNAISTSHRSSVQTDNVEIHMFPFANGFISLPEKMSLKIQMRRGGEYLLTRYIHGVHESQGAISYYKPRREKTGPAWTKTFVNPKTKKPQEYTLYGGKLAGILTQSLCRELFFYLGNEVSRDLASRRVSLIGQFHDEFIADWNPDVARIPMLDAVSAMHSRMTRTNSKFPGLPLEAVVKHSYRYNK